MTPRFNIIDFKQCIKGASSDLSPTFKGRILENNIKFFLLFGGGGGYFLGLKSVVVGASSQCCLFGGHGGPDKTEWAMDQGPRTDQDHPSR